MPVSTASAQVFFLLMTKQHNTFFLWNGYQIDPKITQNILYSHSFKSQNIFYFPISRAAYHFLFLPKS